MFGRSEGGALPADEGGVGGDGEGGGVDAEHADFDLLQKAFLIGGEGGEEGGHEAMGDAVGEGNRIVEVVAGLDGDDGGEEFFGDEGAVGLEGLDDGGFEPGTGLVVGRDAAAGEDGEARSLQGGFPDHAVAEGEGGGDLADGDGEGVVPGRDDEDRADRVPEGAEGLVAGVGGLQLLVDDADDRVEVAEGAMEFLGGLASWFSDLEDDEFEDLVLPGFEIHFPSGEPGEAVGDWLLAPIFL